MRVRQTNLAGPEQRNRACLRNAYLWSCSSHLQNGTSFSQILAKSGQNIEYANLASDLALGAQTVFASGDLNFKQRVNGSNSSAFNYWGSKGFLAADLSNRPTAGGGAIDYLFRKKPAYWAHAPHIANPGLSISDHYFVQGYF